MAQPNGEKHAQGTASSPGREEQWVRPQSAGRRISQGSLQRTSSPMGNLNKGKAPAFDQPQMRLQDAPASPVSISPPRPNIREPDAASIRNAYVEDTGSRRSSRKVHTPDSPRGMQDSIISMPVRSKQVQFGDGRSAHSRASSSSTPQIAEFGPELPEEEHEVAETPGLHYSAFDDAPRKKQNRASQMTAHSAGSDSSGGEARRSQHLLAPAQALQRPPSSNTLGSELRGRTLSPLSANGSDQSPSPRLYARDHSSSRRSPSMRPMSYIDLLNNVPYDQQIAPGPPLSNASLQNAVGSAASLLDTKKTLDMYRANVKKTNDAAVQYEFAVFMVNAANSAVPGDGIEPAELITEAKHILQRLSDRGYPFAQYYLGDGYFSGLFSKDKPDYDKAFPLFVAASKHGHAEAGYRAALCYEFAWGTTKAYPKAVQFYRNAASKNHPGAATRLGLACISGDMGLGRQHRKEGLKWLKRAQESADFQYNAAPYELGLLHLSGYGEDIFKDEGYAAQLLTQAAELGHAQANYIMGQAYENGLYGCPRDAALSVHFYNGAATRSHPEAMMALCAWYMVGAEPVLEKDEGEAYAWAKQAADTGFPKAEYACGYFTEMGIGCRRDPLEANVWYVRAADSGSETAQQRLAIIRAASAGDPGIPMSKAEARSKELGGKDSGGKKKFMGLLRVGSSS